MRLPGGPRGRRGAWRGYTPGVRNVDVQRQIEQLRRFRNRPARDCSMIAEIARVRDEAMRAQRAVEAIGVAWDGAVPLNIRRSVTPVSHVRGVLTVRASDSAARYLFDQWLRAGGLRVLQSSATRTLTRVKVL